jgi:hypothetical protein
MIILSNPRKLARLQNILAGLQNQSHSHAFVAANFDHLIHLNLIFINFVQIDIKF